MPVLFWLIVDLKIGQEKDCTTQLLMSLHKVYLLVYMPIDKSNYWECVALLSLWQGVWLMISHQPSSLQNSIPAILQATVWKYMLFWNSRMHHVHTRRVSITPQIRLLLLIHVYTTYFILYIIRFLFLLAYLLVCLTLFMLINKLSAL